MAASRAMQSIALRSLRRGSLQVRRLSMTGPATQAAPVFSAQAPTIIHNQAVDPNIQLKRPTVEQLPELQPTRQFNTSPVLRAMGDSSTIDFAYLPTNIDAVEEEEIKVPIMPNNYTTSVNAPPDDEEPVMKPEISTMSADMVFLPMSELTDNHSQNVDFHAMADRVAATVRTMAVPAEEKASMMKKIWSDLVDDMLGLSKKESK